MISLLTLLAAIALLDSMSMVPLAVIPMTVALGSARPLSSSLAFLLGIYLAYFICGILLWLGAGVFLEHFGAYLSRLWNQPNAWELSAQIIVGILFVLSAWYLLRTRKRDRETRSVAQVSPWAMLVLGVTLLLAGMPGAVPYVVAIERIVNHDPGWLGGMLYLGFYNLMFVLPFLSLILLRFIMPGHAGRLFQKVADFSLAVMPWLVALLFVAVGLVMIMDGIGWFFGWPLLPVAS